MALHLRPKQINLENWPITHGLLHFQTKVKKLTVKK